MEKVFINKQDQAIAENDILGYDEGAVYADTKQHSKEVFDLFKGYVVEDGLKQVSKHDFSKLKKVGLFTRYLYSGGKDDAYFKGRNWKFEHYMDERHHLKYPDGWLKSDINLLDVLEYICDVICNVRAKGDMELLMSQVTLEDADLRLAFENTVRYLDEHAICANYDEIIEKEEENSEDEDD